jgi:hypothetical protein
MVASLGKKKGSENIALDTFLAPLVSHDAFCKAAM